MDTREWNAFLKASPEANIFQTSEMRDVFAATKNYEPTVLATEMDDEIEDLLLACTIKEGGGLKGAFSSRVVVIGGPITKKGDMKEIVEAFDETVGPDSLYAQFRNLRDMSSHRPVFEDLGYAYEDHINFLHDLTIPIGQIWGGFNAGRRKGIKKAEENGIVVREAEGEEDIELLYGLLSETYDSAGVPLADISLFNSAWRVLRSSNMVRIVLAIKARETLACRLFLTYKGTIYDWYAGSSRVGKEAHANELLVWDTMKWGSRNGFSTFDFGGAGSPGTDYGPGEFKRRFGGAVTSFGRFEKVYHPLKHMIGRKGYGLLKRLG